MVKLSLNATLLVLLHMLCVIQRGLCAPAAAAQRVERTVAADKVEDLKEKLQNIQQLLSGMNEQSKTEPPTTTTVTPVVDEKKVETALRTLVSRLTPEEVKALQSVRRKLDDISQPPAEAGGHQGSFQPFEDTKERTVTRSEESVKDGNPFTEEQLKNLSSKPIDESNAGEAAETKTIIDRQLMDDVEARLIADIRYAHAHGIKLEQIFEDLRAKSKSRKHADEGAAVARGLM